MHKFTVSVAELLGKPGEYRDIALHEALEGISSALGRMGGEPIDARLRLESVMEGILVTGRADVGAVLQCARCLTEFPHALEVELCELYAGRGAASDSEDAYRFTGTEVDLEPMLRDAVALALPLNPLCRDECRGICATCGSDLNFSACTCVEDSIDPRWAALDSLKERLADDAAGARARVPQG